MRFAVIDNKTGKKPDIDKIVKEAWAIGMMAYDINCFAMTEDGELILLDDRGAISYCPDGRFTVIEEDGRVL